MSLCILVLRDNNSDSDLKCERWTELLPAVKSAGPAALRSVSQDKPSSSDPHLQLLIHFFQTYFVTRLSIRSLQQQEPAVF